MPAATLTIVSIAASLMLSLMQGWFQKLVCGTVAKPYNITTIMINRQIFDF